MNYETIMKHLDLFSGIGGFHLAGEIVWGGKFNTIAHVEIDSFCQKVLKKHWPEVPIISDIKEYKHDGAKIDLVTTGFPCQDISTCGKGEGLQGKRSGLWFESFRIICEVRPKFIIIENVAMLLVRGGATVLNCLASIGYNAEWKVLSAKESGAWHERKRLFIVAYPDSLGLVPGFFLEKINNKKCNRTWPSTTTYGAYDIEGRKYPEMAGDLGMANGIQEVLDRLKSLGNAIVPQVVVPIMQTIKQLRMF